MRRRRVEGTECQTAIMGLQHAAVDVLPIEKEREADSDV